MNDRQTLLRLLIQFGGSLPKIKEQLALFEWDSEELVLLERSAVVSLLQKFLAGKLTAVEVEEWANLIEGRDDIGFEAISGIGIRDIIYELANPTLCGALNHERAREMLRRLGCGS